MEIVTNYKMTEEEKKAIITTIGVISEICDFQETTCENCPFWFICRYSDDLPEVLSKIFNKLMI